MKITLDTNILIDAFNLARKEVDQENAKNLLAYHRKKICEIFITTRVDSDTQSKKWKDEIKNIIEEYTIMEISCGLRVNGEKKEEKYSGVGRDCIASEEEKELETKLWKILFPKALKTDPQYPNMVKDIDHLLAHKKHGCAIFVTRDGEGKRGRILKCKRELGEFGIKACSPKEVLDKLENIAGRTIGTINLRL